MVQRYQQGCVEVIQLDDRLMVEELGEVEAALALALQGRLPQLVIDLRRVRLIDSAGLELLHNAHIDSQRRGGAIQLAAATALVRDVLRITGLDQELPLHRDVVSAAGAFAL